MRVGESFLSGPTVASSYRVESDQGGPVAKSTARPMPLDLAFGRRELADTRNCRVVVKADGSMVAYVVNTPPEQRIADGDARWLANGVPRQVPGRRVWVADAASGESTAIGPEGASSWAPWWSPDGGRLAFYCDHSDYVQLWVHDLSKDESHPVSDVKIKAKLWVGDEPYWSRDGTEIYVPLAPEDDKPSGERLDPDEQGGSLGGVTVKVYRSGDGAAADALDINDHYWRENIANLGAVKVADGTVRTLVPADATPPPSVLQVSPSGTWVSYLSVFHRTEDKLDTASPTMFHDLAVVPARGGDVTVVASDIEVSNWREYYLDSYIWHPTRDQLFWVKDQQLWTVELDEAAGEARRLGEELGNFTVAPLAVSGDGSVVVAGIEPFDMHDYRNPHPQALAAVPLDGTEATVIPLPDGVLFEEVVSQNASSAWEPERGTITILGRDRATIEQIVLRFDLTTGTVTTLWSGPAKLRVAGAPDDHRFLAASYEDLNTPADLYIYDTSGHRGRRITAVEPRLKGIRLGSFETFETQVPEHDGTLTAATTAVLLPPGATRGDRLPALLFFYPGGRVSRYAASFGGGMPSGLPVSPFTTRGYAVMLVEAPICPQGPKGGDPLSELVEVLVPQVYRAAELGYIDLERVAIAGQSYGGYGTAATVSGTNLFRAAIAIEGKYDLGGMYAWLNLENGSDRFQWSEAGQGRMGTHPWNALQRYIANSPYYRADRIHTPLLMLHGGADGACPPEEAGKMFNALKRLGRSAQLAIYEGEGHWPPWWSRSNAVDATERMLEFLDQHLDHPP